MQDFILHEFNVINFGIRKGCLSFIMTLFLLYTIRTLILFHALVPSIGLPRYFVESTITYRETSPLSRSSIPISDQSQNYGSRVKVNSKTGDVVWRYLNNNNNNRIQLCTRVLYIFNFSLLL